MKCSAILLATGVFTISLSAFAEESELSVYGTVLPFVDNFRTFGATPEGLSPETGGATQVTADDYSGDNLPNRFRMTSGTSNLGFRGELKLSEDFSAFFQIENAVTPDGDPHILAAAWASRNSGVGLKGTYGTLFFGNWDTPYKHPTLFVGALRGLNPFDNVLTGNPGFNVPGTTTQNGRGSASPDAAFNRRQGNSIQYWTPDIYGFSARAVVSLNEGRTREEFDPSISPVLWGGSLSFHHESLGITYAYEQHLDYFGMDWVGGSPGGTFTNPSSKDDGHELVAWYTLPTNTRLAVVLERLTYRTDDTVVGAVNGYQREAVYGAIQQHLGKHTIWGSYGVANEGRCTTVGNLPCTTNGLNGAQFSVGYTFSPSKSFDIYGGFYGMTNGRSGRYGLFPPVAPIAPGSTTQAFGVGFLYTFDVTAWKGDTEMPSAEAPAASPEAPPAAEVEKPSAPAPAEPAEAAEPRESAEPAEPEATPEPATPAAPEAPAASEPAAP